MTAYRADRHSALRIVTARRALAEPRVLVRDPAAIMRKGSRTGLAQPNVPRVILHDTR